MNGYFWYSEKQRACVQLSLDGQDHHTNFCEIDGKIMEYTEWTDKPSTSGKWDDYRLLGYGKYHHSERYY